MTQYGCNFELLVTALPLFEKCNHLLSPSQTSIGGRIKYSGRLVRLALGSMLDILHQKPFERISVKDFLWGYESPLVRLGNDILPPEEKLPFNKFGIFTGVRNCLPFSSVSGLHCPMLIVQEM